MNALASFGDGDIGYTIVSSTVQLVPFRLVLIGDGLQIFILKDGIEIKRLGMELLRNESSFLGRQLRSIEATLDVRSTPKSSFYHLGHLLLCRMGKNRGRGHNLLKNLSSFLFPRKFGLHKSRLLWMVSTIPLD